MSMSYVREDYTRSRTLCSFEFFGESFRVVRRRFDGKPWRGYLMLLHADVPMTEDFKDGDPQAAASEWLEKLTSLFETREALLEALVAQKQRVEVA